MHVNYRDDVYGKIPTLDYSKLQQGISQSAASLTSILETRLKRLNVPIINGKATFADNHKIIVGTNEFSADYIIIATGTRPKLLPDMSVDGRMVITSDEVNSLKKAPKSILILGAGVIGCEYASIFNALGTQVHLVDTNSQIMSNEDQDISEFIKNAIYSVGIHVIPSSRYFSHKLQNDGVLTELSTGDIKTDIVLLAVGREP